MSMRHEGLGHLPGPYEHELEPLSRRQAPLELQLEFQFPFLVPRVLRELENGRTILRRFPIHLRSIAAEKKKETTGQGTAGVCLEGKKGYWRPLTF
jgi:hypothetical protein